MNTMNRIGLIVTLAVALPLTMSACSSIGGNASRPDTTSSAVKSDPSDDLVAQNLVFVLAQISGFNPKKTTIQIPVEEHDGISSAVYRRVRDAGYITRVVPRDVRNLRVTTQSSGSGVEAGEVVLYTVTIGSVTVSRLYRLIGGSVSPASVISVSDANKATTIIMNDDIFGLGKLDPSISNVVFKTTNNTIATTPVKSKSFQLLEGNIASVISSTATNNIFDSMESNFTNVFSGYEDELSMTVIFGNDSMNLGESGKLQVKEFANSLNPDTDMISVIGCSHGSTNIANGNEVLALGRANRVKKEFMYAGIPKNMILDEGCWAPTRFDEVMPARGVLVTLKRSVG